MQGGESGRGGRQVSVLAERAPSEGPRSTRAGETPSAALMKGANISKQESTTTVEKMQFIEGVTVVE